MPEDSRNQPYLKIIADLASEVVFDWDFYDDPARMIEPISEALYPDLTTSIEALRTALDEMALEYPELTPRYSRFRVAVDPHRGWSKEPATDIIAAIRRAFPEIGEQ